MPKLSYLLTLTPLETWRIARHRLPGLRGRAAWTPQELLSSSKHNRGIRFAELLMRQEAILQNAAEWKPLEFKNKHVVEVGCGPLAGFGPLAIFRGAASFQSAEPEWDEELFKSAEVSERYLGVLHADLEALYGPLMTFDAFRSALSERMAIYRSGFERAPLQDKADIVLSQSVLEHVFPLKDTVAKLASIQTPSARFLHLVDYGNHYPTTNPFEGLYEQEPDAYIARRGKAINLLRLPDTAKLFTDAQIDIRAVPSRRRKAGYTGHIASWWREHYDADALFTQLALVASA